VATLREAHRIRHCVDCGRPYSVAELLDASPHWFAPPYDYDSGSGRYCLACWLGVGPEERGAHCEATGAEAWLAPDRLADALLDPCNPLDLSSLTRFSNLAERFVLFDDPGRLGGGNASPERLTRWLRRKVAETSGLQVTRVEVDDLGWPLCEYAIRLRLVRRIGTAGRPLELLYVRGDAGAAWDSAWGPARIAPRILVETPDHPFTPGRDGRTFTDRFRDVGRYPAIWVLGGWAFHHVVGREYAPPGRHPVRVQSYLHAPGLAAFASDPRWMPLEQDVELAGPCRRVRIVRETVTGRDLAQRGFAAIVGTARAVRWLNQRGLPTSIPRVEVDRSASFGQLLDHVANLNEQLGDGPVAALPVGREDEAGLLLQQWVRVPAPAPPLTLFHKHELDFADLRGWQRNLARVHGG